MREEGDFQGGSGKVAVFRQRFHGKTGDVETKKGYSEYANRNRVNINNFQSTSFMFFNFPDKWGVEQMREAFKRYGAIHDIHMAKAQWSSVWVCKIQR